jgi:hypothetical protein
MNKLEGKIALITGGNSGIVSCTTTTRGYSIRWPLLECSRVMLEV